MPKLLAITLIAVSLSVGMFSVAQAESQKLSGYIYSDNAGWISLSCSNTNSCGSIDYGVLKDSNGALSGYGYSQEQGWINFNPLYTDASGKKYGGVGISSLDELSGLAFGGQTGWVSIDDAKIFSINDLQSSIESAKNIVSSYGSQENISDFGAASLLSSLCNQFFDASQCSSIN